MPGTKSTRQKTLLFILLALTTLYCNRFIEQYQDVGQQLLLNADFSAGLSSWHPARSDDATITITDKEISLRSPTINTRAQIYQKVTVPMGGKMVRLRAFVRTKDVVAGGKPWNKARLLLIQYFDGKARWNLPHGTIDLVGTNDWQEVSAAFTIDPDCIDFRVMVQMSRCSGEFFLKNLELYEAVETPLYSLVKWLI